LASAPKPVPGGFRSKPGVMLAADSMETLRYTTSDRDGAAVLSLSGELVFETARKVERELRNIEERKPSTLALDLSGLSMIDSTGLALVVSADSRARGEGRRLVVVEGPDSVQRVFRMTRLDDRLDIVPSLDAVGENGNAA
jgi:anti-sigma B factor antagonist